MTVHTVTLEDQGVDPAEATRRRTMGQDSASARAQDRAMSRANDRMPVDHSKTCTYVKRGSHKRIAYCDRYVAVGSNYCPAHTIKMAD